MPRYTYEGDAPRSLPEFAIDHVSRGETIDTGDLVIDHPAFKLVREEPKKENKEAKEPKAAAEAPKAAENKE